MKITVRTMDVIFLTCLAIGTITLTYFTAEMCNQAHDLIQKELLQEGSK